MLSLSVFIVASCEDMDAFGTSKRSRRRQLEAARQRKLDGLPGAVAVAEPEAEPVPVAEPDAVGDADTAVGDPPRPSTSATERKFRLMSVGAVSDSDSDSDEPVVQWRRSSHAV